MRVLITGGAGFIGSYTVAACLAAGHSPSVIDDLSTGSIENVPERVPLYRVDIRDAVGLARVFDEMSFEAVCHLVAQSSVGRSMRDVARDADINVVGLIRVLEQSARCGVSRFVFASSGGCLYGDVDHPSRSRPPSAPSARTDSRNGRASSTWPNSPAMMDGVRLCGGTRTCTVHGQSSESDGGVVAIFCRALLAGRPALIFGDGRAVRDFVYVEDVARANVLVLMAIETGCTTLNIGTGVATSINVLVESLAETIKFHQPDVCLPSNLHQAARSGDLRSNLVDAEAARCWFDWQPQTTLEIGLRKTVAWFVRSLLP